MIQTKKNGLLKVAGLMMAVMMLATCVISGTLAKYYSSGSVSGAKVQAAAWSFQVGPSNAALTGSIDVGTLDWNIEATTEGAAADSWEDGKIAPGTWGYAAIAIKNTGEVDANVTVTGSGLLPTETNAGLQFAIMTTLPTQDNIVDESTTLTSDGFELKRASKAGSSNADTKTIYLAYKWEYRNDNLNEDVLEQGKEFEFGTLNINASQIQAS